MAAARALLALGFWVAVLHPVAAEEEDSWPPPTPTAFGCPQCAFGSWTCPYTCDSAHIGRYFDFTYVRGRCWEQMATDETKMAVEVDYQCHTEDDESVTCDNMDTFPIETSFMKGCQATVAGSDDLFTEKCSWRCKDGKPMQRCEWSFDPSIRIQEYYGPVASCWVQPRCLGEGQVEVEAVCEPDDAWQDINTTTARLANAGDQLTKAIWSTRYNLQYLQGDLAAYNETQQALTEAAAEAEAITHSNESSNGTSASGQADSSSEAADTLQAAREKDTAQAERLKRSRDQYNASLVALAVQAQQFETLMQHWQDQAPSNDNLDDLVAFERSANQQLIVIVRKLDEAARRVPEQTVLQNTTLQEQDVAQAAYDISSDRLKAVSEQILGRSPTTEAPTVSTESDKVSTGAVAGVVALLVIVGGGSMVGAYYFRRYLDRRRQAARRARARATASAAADAEAAAETEKPVVDGQPAVGSSVVLGHPVILGHTMGTGAGLGADEETGTKPALREAAQGPAEAPEVDGSSV